MVNTSTTGYVATNRWRAIGISSECSAAQTPSWEEPAQLLSAPTRKRASRRGEPEDSACGVRTATPNPDNRPEEQPANLQIGANPKASRGWSMNVLWTSVGGRVSLGRQTHWPVSVSRWLGAVPRHSAPAPSFLRFARGE